jgi:hypothetical protein
VLLTLMVHGPDPEPTLRGAIRRQPGRPDAPEGFGFFASPGEPWPVFTGQGRSAEDGPDSPVRVWRDGAWLRIEAADGAVVLIADDTTCWQFDRDHDTPVASPRRAVRYAGRGTELLARVAPSAVVGEDVARPAGPIGATTFLGRPAWTVELAPRRHQPYPVPLVIDAETGIVLQRRNDDGRGTVAEWVEFVVGERLDPALFTWVGPVRSADDERRSRETQFEADVAQRRGWFTDNVAALPLRVELDLSVLVHDDATGACQASLGFDHIGMLARRRRSDDLWDLRWSEVQHRWSTANWDWR